MKKIIFLILCFATAISYAKTVNETVNPNSGSFCLGWNNTKVSGGKVKTKFHTCKINGRIYKNYSLTAELSKLINYPEIKIPDKENAGKIALIFWENAVVGIDRGSKNIYAADMIIVETATVMTNWHTVGDILGQDFIKGLEETGGMHIINVR